MSDAIPESGYFAGPPFSLSLSIEKEMVLGASKVQLHYKTRRSRVTGLDTLEVVLKHAQPSHMTLFSVLIVLLVRLSVIYVPSQESHASQSVHSFR